MKKYCLALLAAACLAGCATTNASADAVMGVRPAYLKDTTESVPNAAALTHRMYTPGLDDTYVPQGLASTGPWLFVSSYKPTPDLKANTGPCRVFRIAKATGQVQGQFDIPAGTCTHSGGLAYAGNGRLLLADTRQLFMIDIEKALAAGTSAGAQKTVKIAGLLRGSYAATDGRDVWIGTWTHEPDKALMFRFDSKFFDTYDGQTVQEDKAVESVRVPLEAQGAAFDKAGKLWVSASDSKFGRLYRLDRQGKLEASYEMPAGLEDLTVDDEGQLWGLSESGTLKYLNWNTRFPYIFRIETDRLR